MGIWQSPLSNYELIQLYTKIICFTHNVCRTEICYYSARSITHLLIVGRIDITGYHTIVVFDVFLI